MNRSLIGRLILKDWQLNRWPIALTLVIGFGALWVTQVKAEMPRLVGAVWFFVAMCVLGSMLPGTAVVSERKKQTLTFIMSLPVSSVQYSIAKVVSIWAMFLVPWLALVISALIVIEAHHTNGVIPSLLICATLPLIGFSLISASALVGESEGWLVATSIVVNSSYWLGWLLLSRSASLRADWKGSVAVWGPASRMTLLSELGVIVSILALTLFLQSRKRDFT